MEMSVNRVLEQVAAQNNVTVEEVRREIQLAINASMHAADPVVRARWKLLSQDGTPPTPDELIPLLASICCP